MKDLSSGDNHLSWSCATVVPLFTPSSVLAQIPLTMSRFTGGPRTL
jgi:hypothetical protein